MNVDFSRSGDFVAAFRANASTAPVGGKISGGSFREDFARAFRVATGIDTEDRALGTLLKYCYYDGGKNSWVGVATDKAPWDSLASGSETYSQFGSGEVRAINMAIRDGIMEHMPAEVHYISLGPGTVASFISKENKVIAALSATGHEIVSATTIDINDRYARENATHIYETYNCDATAYQRDFFAEGLSGIAVARKTTPLVGIFGGTVQNMPQTSEHGRKEGTIEFFTKLRKDLPGAHVVMTVDGTPANIDPAIVTAPYQYSLENELFILNFMVNAKDRGIILDPDYNILRHWKVADPEWSRNAVNGYAIAKIDHVLRTVDGDYDIKAGMRLSVSTSKKGPIEEHIDVLSAAGFKYVKHYPLTMQKSDNELGKYILHAAP